VRAALTAETLAAHELVAWGPMEYLQIAVARTLREHVGCLLTTTVVRSELDRLEAIKPRLVGATHERVGDVRLTRVLRALVRDDIPVRDLPRILARLLDYDPVIAPADRIVVDDRPHLTAELPPGPVPVGALCASARLALRRQITQRAGGASLDVVLLEPGLEAELRGRRTLDWASVDDFNASVRRALASGSGAMVLLVAGDLRDLVRSATATAWSRLRVIAFEDLSPDTRLHVVARIGRNDER
jgi:flagellar biosynthesis component FlhA